MNIQASESTIRAVMAALGRASLFDDKITAGDSGRLAAWAELVEPHHLDQADLLEAVTRHYDQPDPPTIQAGALVAKAREIRRARAEREKGTEAASLPAGTAPDPQLGGLPIGGATGEPVWPAYEQWGAIDVECPTCDAQPNEACVLLAPGRTEPLTRRIPCYERIKAGKTAGGQPQPVRGGTDYDGTAN